MPNEIIETHVIDKTSSSPAYHLAIGSALTCRDLSERLTIAGNRILAEELEHLGNNFVRLAELTQEQK